jgi:di/tricarboxylate transporter
MSEVKSEKVTQPLSTVAIIVVVLLVLAGFLRLALTNWGYTILILFVAGAACYIYSQMKK